MQREHQCVSANDCPLCDEYIPSKCQHERICRDRTVVPLSYVCPDCGIYFHVKNIGKFVIELEPQDCTRVPGHSGPCNGWPCETAMKHMSEQELV
jgi:hypothetical protein